jgi:hypothetical protein
MNPIQGPVAIGAGEPHPIQVFGQKPFALSEGVDYPARPVAARIETDWITVSSSKSKT